MRTSFVLPPRRLARAALVLTLAATAASCARNRTDSTGAPQADTTAAAADASGRPRPRNADVITIEEIQQFAGTATNAFELIQQRRPNFLRPRGVRSTGGGGNPVEQNEPRVFLDGIFFGPTQALRELSIGSIVQIRFYSSAAAAVRFGTNQNTSPVIEVTTKK